MMAKKSKPMQRMPRKAGNAYRYVSAFAEANNIKKRAARSMRRAASFRVATIKRYARMIAQLHTLEASYTPCEFSPDVAAYRAALAQRIAAPSMALPTANRNVRRSGFLICEASTDDMRMLQSPLDDDAQISALRERIAAFAQHSPRLFAHAVTLSGTLAESKPAANVAPIKKFPPCVSHRYVEKLDERLRDAMTP